jgi:predicted secreted protein
MNKFFVIEHLDSNGDWKPLCGGARKKRVIEHASTLVEDGYDEEELRVAVYVPEEE